MTKIIEFDTRFPSVEDLRVKAKKRIPKFAFEYLDGGCNEDINLYKNTADIRKVELAPYYLKEYNPSQLKTSLLGKTYDAPFGIAPVGLQGLMWPNAPEILARAAYEHNIPFILSTVTTSSIERIAEITNGEAWFQLYHPTENRLRDDILKRLEDSGYKNLVLLSDVPTFGFRPRDFRNGLAMPPEMTMNNVLQILKRPRWAAATLQEGQPNFESLKPYMDKKMDLKQLGKFMDATFSGRLNAEKIKSLRDSWKGNLILKGVSTESDAEEAVKLGFDALIVSNHGGRQLDAGESTIRPMIRIVERFKDEITIMMDSGLRSGPDIARTLASGAEFTFLGRSFMYGVAALGRKGGDHTISLLKIQLQQIMDQLCCSSTSELKNHLVQSGFKNRR